MVAQIGGYYYTLDPIDAVELLRIAERTQKLDGYGYSGNPFTIAKDQGQKFIESVQYNEVENNTDEPTCVPSPRPTF